ncbi:MAG TPA: MerR family transcriptional regulator [Anaerolineae bacterium]|nr:MerR family transcriptional regulator [Anaerolineae bacterium]
MEQVGPRFNLKAVVQQTGLKPDTLRAWERRYGLPTPERSEGRHRLYSQHDIDTIKWLMARQREGLSIKRAVDLWQQILAEGRDPLRTATPIATSAVPVLAPYAGGETIAELRRNWISACLAYDERQAEQIVNQAFALYPPETVAVELLQKAVAEIGEGWYRGKVTVQQEHFCSGLVIRRMEAMVMAAPLPTRPGRILFACPPQEQHVIGPLLLTFILRRRGWEVVYLGANVPTEQLDSTVAATKPQLVMLAAQQLHTAATLLEMAHQLGKQNVPLAYGGLIFNLVPELRKRIPGHFLGEQLEKAPQVVESLMTVPRAIPAADTVPDRFREARAHFDEQESFIEARLVQARRSMDVAPQLLMIANRGLALNISAALALGDMDYLGTDIDWVKGLLGNYGHPTELLREYLIAYHRAAAEFLDERGEPVVAWLNKVIEENGFHWGG